MTRYVDITVPARQYEDFDDCLAAVARDLVTKQPQLRGYDLSPRWEDEDTRAAIVLTVPTWATTLAILDTDAKAALPLSDYLAIEAGDIHKLTVARIKEAGGGWYSSRSDAETALATGGGGWWFDDEMCSYWVAAAAA